MGSEACLDLGERGGLYRQYPVDTVSLLVLQKSTALPKENYIHICVSLTHMYIYFSHYEIKYNVDKSVFYRAMFLVNVNNNDTALFS